MTTYVHIYINIYLYMLIISAIVVYKSQA